ncbi:MAG: cell division protein ZapA [Firmicutes bacterium]|nr:cell division protein ZapA [Bacillota bacterium]
MGSNKINSVKVSVYGKKYNISGEASRGDIIRCARYVDEKLEMLLGGRDYPVTADILTLTAMNIAEDLYKLKADRDEALEVIKEKDKEIEGYNKLWNEAKDGFRNARQEYVGAREEILSIEEDYEAVKQNAVELDAENRLLKERVKELEEEIDHLKNTNLQMQLFIPPEFEDIDPESAAEIERTKKVIRSAGYSRNRRNSRHNKKSRG